jgi:hypothetical protein
VSVSDNVGVTNIQYYINGTQKCSTTSTQCSWTPTDVGSYIINVRAFDKAGNMNQASVNVTVINSKK